MIVAVIFGVTIMSNVVLYFINRSSRKKIARNEHLLDVLNSTRKP